MIEHIILVLLGVVVAQQIVLCAFCIVRLKHIYRAVTKENSNDKRKRCKQKRIMTAHERTLAAWREVKR